MQRLLIACVSFVMTVVSFIAGLGGDVYENHWHQWQTQERIRRAGGMAEVYLADDQRLGRKIALKLLPDYFIRDPTRLHRFEQEARTVAGGIHTASY